MDPNIRKKVLIIEDDQSLAAAYRARLSSVYDTRGEVTGDNGLKAAYDWKPNLILLDLFLPGKNGQEVLKELKKNEITKNIPIIVLTNLDGQYKQILEMGAKDCAIKAEISMDDIIEKIDRYMLQIT